MQSPITRRRLLASGAGGGLALLAGCTSSTPFVGQRLTMHRSVVPETEDAIRIMGEVGSVDVVGEDRADVDIDVVKQSSSVRTDLEDLTLETTSEDGTIVVRTEYDGEEGLFESRPSMDLDVSIPSSMRLEVVETATGRVTVTNVTGDPNITTSTGRVTVEEVDGSVDVVTTTGRVSVSNVDGVASVRTTTGRIHVEDIGVLGNVNSTTGRIDVEVPAIDGDTRVSATTGRIAGAIAENLDAELVASTSTGGISDDLSLSDRTEHQNYLAGTLGDGGPTLEFETNTGRIELTSK